MGQRTPQIHPAGVPVPAPSHRHRCYRGPVATSIPDPIRSGNRGGNHLGRGPPRRVHQGGERDASGFGATIPIGGLFGGEDGEEHGGKCTSGGELSAVSPQSPVPGPQC